MALNTLKCNHLTPLGLKGLNHKPTKVLWQSISNVNKHAEFAPETLCWLKTVRSEEASAVMWSSPLCRRYSWAKKTWRQQETTSASLPGLFPKYDLNSAKRTQDNNVNRASRNMLWESCSAGDFARHLR